MLYRHSSNEFQYFYEILLARRLLHDRYFNISMEYHVLYQLPAMTKSHKMLYDLEYSQYLIQEFRRHILNNMDRKHQSINKYNDMNTLLDSQSESLSILHLNAMNWPSSMVSPILYAGLKLPAVIQSIKDQYESFSENYAINHRTFNIDSISSNDKLMRSHLLPVKISCKALAIHDTFEVDYMTDEEFEYRNKYHTNGNPFDPHNLHNTSNYERLFYRTKRDISDSIRYSKEKCQWDYIAYDGVSELLKAYHKSEKFVPLHLLSSNLWIVTKESFQSTYLSSSSISKSLSMNQKVSSFHFAIQIHKDKESFKKQVHWCHERGSVDVICHVNDSIQYHLHLIEPQAALLCLFDNSFTDNTATNRQPLIKLSIREMSSKLNLSSKEVSHLCDSLSSARSPILSYDGIDSYTLSSSFLSGSINRHKDMNDNMINLAKHLERNIENDELIAESVFIRKDWRNELIDANIVKYLKEIHISKGGDVSYGYLCDMKAVSVDQLCQAMKNQANLSLSNITDEEVLRRSDHLSNIGVIEKVTGEAIGLRSIGFCYTSEIDVRNSNKDLTRQRSSSSKDSFSASLSNPLSPKKISETNMTDKTAASLYDRLCFSLLIPSSNTKISKALFAKKFVDWMSRSNVLTDFSMAAADNSWQLLHHLIQSMQTLDVQLFALRELFESSQGEQGRDRRANDTWDSQDKDINDLSDRLFEGLQRIKRALKRNDSFSIFTDDNQTNSHDRPGRGRINDNESIKRSNDNQEEISLNELENNLYKILFHHLPIPLMRKLLNICRGSLGLPIFEYSDIDDLKASNFKASAFDQTIPIDLQPFCEDMYDLGDLNEMNIEVRQELILEFDQLLSYPPTMVNVSSLHSCLHPEVLSYLFILRSKAQQSQRTIAPLKSSLSSNLFENLVKEDQISPSDVPDSLAFDSSANHEANNPWIVQNTVMSDEEPIWQPLTDSEITSLFFQTDTESVYDEAAAWTDLANQSNDRRHNSRNMRLNNSISENSRVLIDFPRLYTSDIRQFDHVNPQTASSSRNNILRDRINDIRGYVSRAAEMEAFYGFIDEEDDEDDDEEEEEEEQGDDTTRDRDHNFLIQAQGPGDRMNARMIPSQIPYHGDRSRDQSYVRTDSDDPHAKAFHRLNHSKRLSKYEAFPRSLNKNKLIDEQLKHSSKHFYSSSVQSNQILVDVMGVVRGHFIAAEPNVFSILFNDTRKQISWISFSHRYFLLQLAPNMANLLNIKLSYDIDSIPSTDNPKTSSSKSPAKSPGKSPRKSLGIESNDKTESEEIIYLPCEFCTETIPMRYFQDHQTACQRGLRFVIPSTSMKSNDISSNASSMKAKEGSMLKSYPPLASGGLIFSLIVSLFDLIGSEAIKASQTDSHTSISHEKSIVHMKSGFLGTILGQTFDLLDADKTGFITKQSLARCDPSDLYEPNASIPEDKKSHKLSSESSGASDFSLNPSKEAQGLAKEIPLIKVDSMITAINQDKTLPLVDSNKSLFGLDGAMKELKTLICRVADVIDQSEAITIALLSHYRFNYKKLIDEFIGNQANIFQTIGLGPSNQPSYQRYDLYGRSNRIATFSPQQDDDIIYTCNICFTEHSGNQIYSLSYCNHWFCMDCWHGYILSNIREKEVHFKCPHPKCPSIVPFDMIEHLCTKEEYQEAMNHLVE